MSDAVAGGAGSAAAPASRSRVAAVPRSARSYITWVTLAFMITSSVASLRAAPTMAVYGLAAVFLYVVPAILFLLPTSLVSAELASGWSGGVYRWVADGLSKPLGFLAVWCQFAMTIFYYPSLLGYVASTFAYVINPALANNGLYVAIVIVVVYWAGVYISSQGTKTVAGLSKRRADHRDAHPGRDPRRPRDRVPRPGQHVGRPDGLQPPAAAVDRHRVARAHRQQLPVLRGHGDERGARHEPAQAGA